MTVRVARFRAVLAYDGSGFYGFQRQAGDTPTIQGTVEAAIERVTQQPVPVIGAGRTDSGVHAAGQVIAFDVAWQHTTNDLWRALNANLPDTIAIRSLEETAPDFHPRFSARSRTYVYTLYAAPVRQPLLGRYAWHVPSRTALDLSAMAQGAARLIGWHDFATFGQPPQGENTVREVLRSAFDEGPGPVPGEPVIRYTIEANAFLYRMVRRIVGALVRIGQGALSLDEFDAIFRAADVLWPNQTAPACGLCLTEVTY